MSDSPLQRYEKHYKLNEIGQTGQKKLSQARVLCVGVGGLGSHVALTLACAGVGTLTLLDHDQVELSNLPRQPLYDESHLGQSKAITAKAVLQQKNSTIVIHAGQEAFSKKNAKTLADAHDIIVDCSDNFTCKYLVNDVALQSECIAITASIFKFSGTLLTVSDRSSPCYRCLYPSPPSAALIPNCSDVGVLSSVPALVGQLQANAVLN